MSQLDALDAQENDEISENGIDKPASGDSVKGMDSN